MHNGRDISFLTNIVVIRFVQFIALKCVSVCECVELLCKNCIEHNDALFPMRILSLFSLLDFVFFVIDSILLPATS